MSNSKKLPWQRMGLVKPDYLALPVAARIAIAAAPFLGYRYIRHDSEVAYAVGATPPALVGTKWRTNCSSMTSAIIQAVYPDAGWTIRDYLKLQVSGKGYEADWPIDAVVGRDIAKRQDSFTPGCWHLVQAWRGKVPDDGGHAYLVYCHPDGATLQILEASSAGDIGPRLVERTLGWLRKRYRGGIYIGRLL